MRGAVRTAVGASMAAATLAMTLLATSAPSLSAQGAGSKLWEGVYTDAQAERGEIAFKGRQCGSCHSVDLTGGEGPSLKGRTFIAHWENGSLNDLWLKVRNTMPPNVLAGDIADGIKIDIVAFLLKSNGFPSGPAELKADTAALDDIPILARGMTTPDVRNFALVQVVGCLAEGSDRRWTLTRTSKPIVVKEETPTPAALEKSRVQELGADKFTLVSVVATLHAETYKGQKVAARGLVYLAPNDNRLNLTSLETLSTSCGN